MDHLIKTPSIKTNEKDAPPHLYLKQSETRETIESSKPITSTTAPYEKFNRIFFCFTDAMKPRLKFNINSIDVGGGPYTHGAGVRSWPSPDRWPI